jgi:hypothetical protein
MCRWYELEGSVPTELLMASELSRTTAFQSIVRRMIESPQECVEHYNQAITTTQDAELRPLARQPQRNRYELPLWLLRDGEPRKRVYSDELAVLPREKWQQLAPRAILMTGLLRAYGCDLFIHGAGGGIYDPAAEAWFKSWLSVDLAPKSIATATVLLPLTDGKIPSEQDVQRAWWRVQRAKHDPSILGDDTASRTKQALIQEIREAKERGAPTLSLYRSMHASLEAYRASQGAALSQLTAEAEALQLRAAESRIASDRTWPFPLHSPDTIRSLRDAIWTELRRT